MHHERHKHEKPPTEIKHLRYEEPLPTDPAGDESMFLRLDRRRGEGGRPAGWRQQDLVGNIGEAGKSIIKNENVMESNRVGRKKQAWIFSKKEVSTVAYSYIFPQGNSL